MAGTLYLVPNFIGDYSIHTAFAPINASIIEKCNSYVVENIKPARKLIKALHKEANIDQMIFWSMNKHEGNQEIIPTILKVLQRGDHVCLISDAGCPGVADPGSDIVIAAHKQGIRVEPLIGPSSILLTLMASGLNGQNFAFNGYLSKLQADRIKDLKRLENKIRSENQTQLFIETPYRIQHLIDDILQNVYPEYLLCIGIDIQMPSQKITTKSIAEWKKNKPSLDKQQVVFALGKAL